jgi:predicted aspartyl protease
LGQTILKFLPLIAVLGVVLGASPARCQQTFSAHGTVNVTITRERKMFVEAWVNGSRGNFMVDTGAGNSYMGEKFADSLQVRRDQGGYSYNVLGSMRFDVADVNSLELGANRVPMRHGLIHVSNLGWTNKGSANSIIENPIHGIIGADILIHNQAVIDCAQHRISFGYPGAQGASSPKRTVTLVPRRGEEIAVVARVNGVDGTFIVDTGYNISLLSPGFAGALNARGRGGVASRSRVISITSLELGMSRLPVRPGQMIVSGGVDVANQGYIDQGEAPYDGVLGMDFLMNNHAVIDCIQRQLHFD